MMSMPGLHSTPDAHHGWPDVVRQELQPLISRPLLTTKLLSKPPFRFLHDIITNLKKATVVFPPDGYFTPFELDSAQISQDRNCKIHFLQKLIALVEFVTGIEIRAKPSKIVAGMEADLTGELLAATAQAARRDPDPFLVDLLDDCNTTSSPTSYTTAATTLLIAPHNRRWQCNLDADPAERLNVEGFLKKGKYQLCLLQLHPHTGRFEAQTIACCNSVGVRDYFDSTSTTTTGMEEGGGIVPPYRFLRRDKGQYRLHGYSHEGGEEGRRSNTFHLRDISFKLETSVATLSTGVGGLSSSQGQEQSAVLPPCQRKNVLEYAPQMGCWQCRVEEVAGRDISSTSRLVGWFGCVDLDKVGGGGPTNFFSTEGARKCIPCLIPSSRLPVLPWLDSIESLQVERKTSKYERQCPDWKALRQEFSLPFETSTKELLPRDLREKCRGFLFPTFDETVEFGSKELFSLGEDDDCKGKDVLRSTKTTTTGCEGSVYTWSPANGGHRKTVPPVSSVIDDSDSTGELSSD